MVEVGTKVGHGLLDLYLPRGPRRLRRVPDDGVQRPYRHLAIAPLARTFGAEVAGVDPSTTPDEAIWGDLDPQHYPMGDYTEPSSLFRATVRGERLR